MLFTKYNRFKMCEGSLCTHFFLSFSHHCRFTKVLLMDEGCFNFLHASISVMDLGDMLMEHITCLFLAK